MAPKTSAARLAEILQKHVGVSVVSMEEDGAVIAFRDDIDLSRFRDAVEAYQKGPREDLSHKTTKFDEFEIIEPDQMRLYGRADRIGKRLASVVGVQGENINVDSYYVLDVELWHRGSDRLAHDSITELRRLVQSETRPGEKLSDYYVGNMLCLARVAVFGGKLNCLLDVDLVAEVDLPPQPIFDRRAADRTTIRDFPTPPKPPVDGPRLCVLDSGIASGHKLLANNIGHEEAILTGAHSPADDCGHGTMVGGLAVFGDVRACYESGGFASPVTLFSAKVLNSQGRFDEEKQIISQMYDAIKAFSSAPFNCRVFNLSLGDDGPLLTDSNKRQGRWAEALDILARELGVLLVISAGNHDTAVAKLAHDAEPALSDYPNYLFQPEATLCDPATAAIPITVGALARYEVPEVRNERHEGDVIRTIAATGEPTPSTRIGPGINGAWKPEFVAHGGNILFQGFRQDRQTVRVDSGIAVMSFSHTPAEGLFAFDVGTSFAAPQVARLGALVWDRLRRCFESEPQANLVRAVLATAAVRPAAACSLIERAKGQKYVARVCGYGVIEEALALESSDRRVTMVTQGAIGIDKFRIYRIPVPVCFQRAPGDKRIIVALAYDPPVRRRRSKYLGVDMSFYLYRNKTLDEVVEANRALTEDQRRKKNFPAPIKDRCLCKLKPGVASLATSTLQRREWSPKKMLRDEDVFYLLVRAERNWAPPEITHQDFAVAVTLEANDSRLYTWVRERIPTRQRTRLRQ